MNSNRPASPVSLIGKPRIAAPCVCAVLATLASGAVLASSLSADAIAEAIGDRTYQGSMTADAFAEFYAKDGTVQGDGYIGQWRTEDDALCLTYEGADEQCWQVELNGPAMTLFRNGEVDGSGMLVEGNPLGL